MSNTSWQVKKRYNDKMYRQFNFRVPKEIGDLFVEVCRREHFSMTGIMEAAMLNIIIPNFPDLEERLVSKYYDDDQI